MCWFPWNSGKQQEPSQSREQLQFQKMLNECEEQEDKEEKSEEVTQNRCHPMFFDLDPHHSRR